MAKERDGVIRTSIPLGDLLDAFGPERSLGVCKCWMSGGCKAERNKRTNVGDFAFGATGILAELTVFG
jgi:hypothetical protein